MVTPIKVCQYNLLYDTWLKRKCSQGVIWSIGFVEMAIIVAREWPLPSEILSKILSVFMPNGSGPENLHITHLSAGGMMCIAFGGILRLWCYRTLKHLFTYEISIRKDHKLVTTGPYSVVRHPGYSGMLIAHIGAIYWYGTRGSWLRESGVLDTAGGKIFFGSFAAFMMTVVFGLLKRGALEDRAMREAFGKQWDEWARRVPYSYVPWIY